jgi:glycosyltransferase 2 family protein
MGYNYQYENVEGSAPFRRRARRYLLPLGKAMVSLAALIYIAQGIDRTAIVDAVRSTHGWFLILALSQMILIPILGGIRWQLILKRLGWPMSLQPLTRLFWVGMAFNQILPSAVGGDAVRVVLACREGVNGTMSAVSVLVERCMMTLSLVLVVVLTVSYAPVGTLDSSLIGLAAVLLGIGLAGLALLPLLHWLLTKAPETRIVRLAIHVVDGLKRVIFSSGAVPLMILCLITNLNLGIAAWWLALGFGLTLSLSQVLAVISMVTLAVVIPVSIGGWGVREAAMVMLLGRLAVPADNAFLFSVAFGLAVAVSSLPGLLFLWWRPRKLEQQRQFALTEASQ